MEQWNGKELKKFNIRDRKGFEFLRKFGTKIIIITSENIDILDKNMLNVKNNKNLIKLKIFYNWKIFYVYVVRYMIT